MPAQTRSPMPEPTKWTGFPRRLGYFLLGLAIGCVVLGAFRMARDHQAQVDAEHKKQLQALPRPEDKLFPPIPASQPEKPAPPAAPSK